MMCFRSNNATTFGNDETYASLLIKSAEASSPHTGISIFIYEDKKIQARTSANVKIITGQLAYDITEWNHLTFMRKGGKLKLYLNGHEFVRYWNTGTNYTYNATDTTNVTQNAPFRFGSNHMGTTGQHWSHLQMRNFAVYSRGLDEQEVQSASFWSLNATGTRLVESLTFRPDITSSLGFDGKTFSPQDTEKS